MPIKEQANYLIINNSGCLFTVAAERLKNNEIEIKDIATWNKIKTQADE